MCVLFQEFVKCTINGAHPASCFCFCFYSYYYKTEISPPNTPACERAYLFKSSAPLPMTSSAFRPATKPTSQCYVFFSSNPMCTSLCEKLRPCASASASTSTITKAQARALYIMIARVCVVLSYKSKAALVCLLFHKPIDDVPM